MPPGLIVIPAQAAATATTEMGDPLTIVTISPATGICAGLQDAATFQFPPAPVEEIFVA